jgi:hypothetical protein
MAIAFRAAASNATLSAGSLSVNVPAGTTTDDVMIAVITVRTGTSVDNAITAPGGWTLIHDAYDAGSPASYAWTFASSNEPCGSILSYSGVNTTTPIHAQSAGVQGTGSVTRTTPSIDVTTPGCWILSWFADRSGSTWTGPDTERSEVRVPATSSSQVVCDSAATVATGSTSRTATASASTSVAEQGIIALAPPGEEHAGTATITGSLGVAASGTPGLDGTGALAGALNVTGTGTLALDGGTATIGGLLTLTATGTADTGIGVPPRPRTRWQLIAGPAAGGHDLALTEATARKYVAKLEDPSELSFTLDGRHAQALGVDALTRDVHLLWTSESGQTRILDRLRVGTLQDEVTDAAHAVQVTCLDYKGVLSRRRLFTGATLTFDDVDQAEIAWGLVSYTQGLSGGNLGISKGWMGSAPTGQVRDRTYELGDSVGERIRELSEVIDGFDWDITPISASALRLDVWYPERGSDRGVVLIHGGLVESASRTEDSGEYANALRYTGAAGDDVTPGPTPVELAAPDIGGVEQGRWDAVFGDDGLINQSTLDDRAAWQLGQSQVVPVTWTVRLRRGGWGGPDHIWLGDWVRLIVKSGRLGVDQSYRVYEVQIDLDGDGGEDVTLSLGGPRPDFRRRASETAKRLRNLERR